MAERASEESAYVGEQIRRVREDAGISITDLATRMGISRPMLSSIEAGRRECSLTNLLGASRALGVQPSDLLPRTEQARTLSAAKARVLAAMRDLEELLK